MSKCLASFLVLVFFSMVTAAVKGDCIWPSPDLPPADGVYRSASDVHTIYNFGPGFVVDLTNIRHFGFTNVVYTPINGGTHEQFDSIVTGMVSVNSSPYIPITMTGPVGVDLFDNYTPGAIGTFNTEMVSLNLTGGGGEMIRESPTLTSAGQTTIQDLGGGSYHIDSFFDVFTELSLDGGQTWIPAVDPTPMNSSCVPEPSSLALLSLGGISLGFAACRRRRAAAV